MTGTRDTQRKRLYDAERDATLTPSPTAHRLLVDTPRVASTGSVTIESCQRYIDHLTQSAWFQRRWGRRQFTAIHKVYGSATGGYTRIALPPWARDEWVILHEVAHGLTYGGWAPHGPEFAGVFLTLVEHRMGAVVAASLRASFRAHRVRYTMKAVPAPTRKVRPVAEPVRLPSKAAAAAARAAIETKTARVQRAAYSRSPGWNLDPREGGWGLWTTSRLHVVEYAATRAAAGCLTEAASYTDKQGTRPARWVAAACADGAFHVTVTVDDGLMFAWIAAPKAVA